MIWRHWLARLVTALTGRHRHAVRGETAMSPHEHQHTDAAPALPPPDVEMSPEQAAALARVREIYHRGTQPLTVAKARYQLIQRGAFDDPRYA